MDWPAKAVTIFGMSGVGKTSLARMLRHHDWFHYSVDYRIGTRYMGEHIVDNFKKEAMKNPFLRDLLRTDSIYISSNITFENLDPLSTYLGKPGNPDKGGISFADYLERQEQHREAEIAALHDVPMFVKKARDIYGYQHFICDSGGSLCEVVDVRDDKDPVMRSLAAHTLLLYIRGTPEHADELIAKVADHARALGSTRWLPASAPRPMSTPMRSSSGGSGSSCITASRFMRPLRGNMATLWTCSASPRSPTRRRSSSSSARCWRRGKGPPPPSLPPASLASRAAAI